MARITDNKHIFHWNGETVTITRRVVGKRTALRVRVTVTQYGKVTRNDYRDYRGGEWSHGESVFAGHVSKFQRLIDSECRKAWNGN